jgi:hypothetical protein
MKSRLTDRESRLVNAATRVSTLWALVMVGGGQHGDHGMARALEELAEALDDYSPEEVSDE